jgi:flagellar hook-length control protein FliK
MKGMKTVGLDAVLNALKGDSAPITKDKTPAGEGNAFNAAFDAAARSAGEPTPVNGSASASPGADKSPQGGNALPDNGKELPSSGDDNLAVEAGSGGMAVDSFPTGELAPSPFMKAALDKAVGGSAMEKPLSSPSHLSATSPPNTLSPTEEPSVAQRPFGQDLMAASKGAVAPSGYAEGSRSNSTEVASATGTLKDQNLLATPRSASVAMGTSTASGLPVTPMSTSDGAGNLNSAAAPGALGTTPSTLSASGLPVTPMSTSDGAGNLNSAAAPGALGTTPSTLSASGLPVTPTPTSDLAGTQKLSATFTEMGAAQDNSAHQRPSPAGNTQIADGPLNRAAGGAVSMAQGTGVNTDSSTTGVSGSGNSEITRALQGESFGAALNSSLVRAKDFREASPVENQPRTRVADAASVAGLNPTPRSAESSTMSAVTQVPAMKAAPDAAGFPQEVLTRVRMIQGQGQTEARINLHPAELGRLQIAVTSEGDATRVAFVVDNAQAKEALEQAMPRLREFLQQAGLQLAEGSVSQQGQQNSAGFAHSETRSGDGHSANAHDAEEDVVINGKSDRGSDPSRMLDAYA